MPPSRYDDWRGQEPYRGGVISCTATISRAEQLVTNGLTLSLEPLLDGLNFIPKSSPQTNITPEGGARPLIEHNAAVTKQRQETTGGIRALPEIRDAFPK